MSLRVSAMVIAVELENRELKDSSIMLTQQETIQYNMFLFNKL